MPGISIEKPRGHEMPEWFSSESETVLEEVDPIRNSCECIPGYSPFNHSLCTKSAGQLYDSDVLV
jgi:hypothetical protein